MHRAWFSRLFFVTVAATAVAVMLGGTACTKWGKPGPVPPTIVPLSQIYVSPASGSDTTGNGSMTKPYKSFTKALAVLEASKNNAPAGVTIYLAAGDYNVHNGEIFPIVIPANVTVDGTGYGSGPKSGTFIDGAGQDKLFEELVHAPAQSTYATLEVVPGASVSLSSVYVGASKLTLPGPKASYFSLDDLGTLVTSGSSFGAGIVSSSPAVSGVLVAGGSFDCSSCQIHGNGFGIGALTVPVTSSQSTSSGSGSGSGSGPSVTLTQGNGDSTIEAKLADIITDGTVNVTASNERFERGTYAFTDSLHPVVDVTTRGAIDFGGGVASSAGGNNFIGARSSEISIVRRSETISALDDTWNPEQQQANHGGQYTRMITFRPGASGKNVKILSDADGSTVTVGPAPVPTPTPTSPSGSPTPTPT